MTRGRLPRIALIVVVAAAAVAGVLAVIAPTHGASAGRRATVTGVVTATPRQQRSAAVAGGAQGSVRLLRFWSPALHRRDQVAVYLPRGYAAAAGRGQRFAVLYLLHPPRGSPLDYLTLGHLGAADDALAHPMLLAMPFGHSNRFGNDTEWANAEAGRYESYVLDAARAVDRAYPTIADRAHRGLAGLSEGGYGALNIGLHRLGSFSVVQSWSGYFTQTPTTAFHNASPALLRANSPAQYVGALAGRIRRLGLHAFLYQGEKDEVHPELVQAFSAQLAAAGGDVTWGYFPGGHRWGMWRREGPRMLRAAARWFATPPGRTPRGALVRVGGQAAPFDSYYHYRGRPKRAK